MVTFLRDRIYEEIKGLDGKGMFGEWRLKHGGKVGVACKGGWCRYRG